MKKLNGFDKFIILSLILILVTFILYFSLSQRNIVYTFEIKFPIEAQISVGDIIYDYNKDEKIGKVTHISEDYSYILYEDKKLGRYINIKDTQYKKVIISTIAREMDIKAGDTLKVICAKYFGEGECIYRGIKNNEE